MPLLFLFLPRVFLDRFGAFFARFVQHSFGREKCARHIELLLACGYRIVLHAPDKCRVLQMIEGVWDASVDRCTRKGDQNKEVMYKLYIGYLVHLHALVFSALISNV